MSNNFEIILEGRLLSSQEKSLLGDAIYHLVHSGSPQLEVIWPKFTTDAGSIRLCLLPLYRLGSEQGKSGNHVIVGFMEVAEDGDKYPCSWPLLIKMSCTHDPPTDGRNKLIEERDNCDKIKKHIEGSGPYINNFATPIYCYSCDVGSSDSVLISPFISQKWASKSENIEDNLYARCLADYLEDGDFAFCMEVLGRTYNVLEFLHTNRGEFSRDQKLKSVKLIEEYDWYLRGFPGAGWAVRWQAAWLDNNIEPFKTAYTTNPLEVFQRLKDIEAEIVCSAIHGDLHPRNIVVNPHSQPFLIDYGWSDDEAHVAKDYVLMECNLRSMYFDCFVGPNSIMHLNQRIDRLNDKPVPEITDDYIDNIYGLISLVRSNARKIIGDENDFITNYIIPLYFVTLGLSLHLRDAGNQLSAAMMVWHLSDYINQELFSR